MSELTELKEINERMEKELVTAQRIARRNNGINFANYDEPRDTAQKSIKIRAHVKQDFINGETLSWETYTHGFHVSDWRTSTANPSYFLKELEHYCKIPLYDVPQHNRKNHVWSNNLPDFRTEHIRFEDIVIDVSTFAREKMEEAGLHFEAELQNILDLQREATLHEKKLCDEIMLIAEQDKVLGELEHRDRSFYYRDERDQQRFEMTEKQREKAREKLKLRLEAIYEELTFLKPQQSQESYYDSEDEDDGEEGDEEDGM